MTTKRCAKCGEVKPHSEFHKSRSRPDGLFQYCKECACRRARAWRDDNPERSREMNRRWKEANPERYWSTQLQRLYNITSAEYDKILSDQNGCCAICEIDKCPSGNRFSVDHDHSCCPGIKSCGHCVRGLLCRNCNQAIGGLNDSYETILRAAEYVKQGPRRP